MAPLKAKILISFILLIVLLMLPDEATSQRRRRGMIASNKMCIRDRISKDMGAVHLSGRPLANFTRASGTFSRACLSDGCEMCIRDRAVSLAIVTAQTLYSLLNDPADGFTEIMIAVGALIACCLQFILGKTIGSVYNDRISRGEAVGQKMCIRDRSYFTSGIRISFHERNKTGRSQRRVFNGRTFRTDV